MRLDSYLVENNLAVSRNKAQQLINLERIKVNDKIIKKASFNVSDTDRVEVISELEFVSMGGYKLEKAISEFGIDINGKTCIDVGASNGGFTHCMLKHGACKVFAVDVGECALEPTIRDDSRVIIRDRLNAREMSIDDIGCLADFISIDVSFISLSYIMYNVLKLLSCDGTLVALIKPQFEAGRKALSKTGIVTDKKQHIKVIADILELVKGLGMVVTKLTYAPIREGKNIEYLIEVKHSGKCININYIESLVKGIA